MTITMEFTVEETANIKRPDGSTGHRISLRDVNGNTRHEASGESRDLCIAGLRALGFTVTQ